MQIQSDLLLYSLCEDHDQVQPVGTSDHNLSVLAVKSHSRKEEHHQQHKAMRCFNDHGFSVTHLSNDGWSTEDEATATCFCGAVQVVLVSLSKRSLLRYHFAFAFHHS